MTRIIWLGLLLSASMACPAQQGVMGNWSTPSGSVVNIVGCGTEICLTIIKVDPSVPATTDVHNPDSSLRSRPLCGLLIGSGFRLESADTASGGHIYDPKNGRTYSGKFWLKDQTLHLRGYVGISLFGRSEIWNRADGVGACR